MSDAQDRLAAALQADAEGMTYEEWVAAETTDPWQGLAADVLLAIRRAGLALRATPGQGDGLREALERLHGIAGTIVGIKERVTAGEFVAHPYIWHDLSDSVRAIDAEYRALATPAPDREP